MKRTCVLALLTALSVGGNVGAAPNVVSNTSVILVSSLTGPAGEELFLTGQLHVQANVHADGDVEVKANLTQSAIGFTANGSALPPEVDAIRARIVEIKIELISLDEQLKVVEGELVEIRQIDLFPNIPGLQFNDKRVRELRAAMGELTRRMVALQQELEALLERLEQLLNVFRNSRPDLVTLYTPIGADAFAAPGCTGELLCDSVLNFALVTEDGDVLPFQLHLTLAFTADGGLASVDVITCEWVCDSDSGLCSCS